MADLRLYMETTAGVSPSTASVSVRGGLKSVRNYIIGQDGQTATGHEAITDPIEVTDAIIELTGSTHTHNDGYRLKRVQPKADPFFWWCYCEGISDIRGVGRPSQFTTDGPGIFEASLISKSAMYPGWRFGGCSFTPRPFAVLKDDSIPTGVTSIYRENGTVQSDVTYAQEWLRYVDVETIPSGEYVTANAGRFIFDVAASAVPHGKSAGNGQLRMFLKKKTIKMTWYHVPELYVNTQDPTIESYIDRTIGKVNQYDWWNYGKGTLLLEGINVVRYTPIVPDVLEWSGSAGVFANQKLVDITFFFTEMNPTRGAAELAVTTGTQDVPHGHNLVPFAHTSSWYYVKTQVPGHAASSGRPIIPSFPYQFLFTNPGVIA
jgi:hypothetical protein